MHLALVRRALHCAPLVCFIASFSVLIAPSSAQAANCTIPASTTWSTAGCASATSGETVRVQNGATLTLDAPVTTQANIIVDAGGTLDLAGTSLDVTGATIDLAGDATAAATLTSTGGSRGTITIDGMSDLILRRADLTAVDVTGGSTTTLRILPPDSASVALTSTWTDAIVDVSASATTAFFGCRTDRTCYDYTIERSGGFDISELRLPAAASFDRDGGQLVFDLPVKVDPITPAWAFSSQSLPPAPGAANALVVVNGSLLTTSGGTPSITVVADWSAVAPAPSLGDEASLIAIGDTTPFTGNDQFLQDILYRTDTTGSPQLFNALQGPQVDNTFLPVISGSAVVGQMLSASTGSWSPAPTSYAYQWLTNGGAGSTFTAIGGATSSTYTLQPGDAGAQVKVRVTASDVTTPSLDGVATSNAVTVTLPTIANSAAPVIGGTAVPGVADTFRLDSTLSTTNGTWTPAPTTTTYQWYAKAPGAGAFATVAGATSATFDPSSLASGTQVKVGVSAGASGYQSATSESAVVSVITPVITNATLPVVSGPSPLAAGATLTTTVGTWNLASGDLTFAYQWQSRATGSTGTWTSAGTSATLASVQGGQDYRVAITASRTGYSSATATSAAVSIPLPPPTFTISGPARVPVGVPVPITSSSVDPRLTVIGGCGATADHEVFCNRVSDPMWVKPTRTGPITITRTLKTATGEAVTATWSTTVVVPTQSEVLRGEGRLEYMNVLYFTGARHYVLSSSVFNGWKLDCSTITGMVDGALPLSTGVVLKCRAGTGLGQFREDKGYHPEWGNLQKGYLPALEADLTTQEFEPIRGSVKVVLRHTSGVSVDLEIPYSIDGTGNAAGSHQAHGNVIDDTKPLTCASPPAGAAPVLYGWAITVGDKVSYVSGVATLPRDQVPANGTVACNVLYFQGGEWRGISTQISVSRDASGRPVRVGVAAISHAVIKAGDGRKAVRTTAQRRYMVRLQASGRRVARVHAFQRVVTKVGEVQRTQYVLRGMHTVALRRGTSTVRMTLPSARAGYRIVVTPIRWRSARDHTIVRGPGITLDVQ